MKEMIATQFQLSTLGLALFVLMALAITLLAVYSFRTRKLMVIMLGQHLGLIKTVISLQDKLRLFTETTTKSFIEIAKDGPKLIESVKENLENKMNHIREEIGVIDVELEQMHERLNEFEEDFEDDDDFNMDDDDFGMDEMNEMMDEMEEELITKIMKADLFDDLMNNFDLSASSDGNTISGTRKKNKKSGKTGNPAKDYIYKLRHERDFRENEDTTMFNAFLIYRNETGGFRNEKGYVATTELNVKCIDLAEQMIKACMAINYEASYPGEGLQRYFDTLKEDQKYFNSHVKALATWLYQCILGYRIEEYAGGYMSQNDEKDAIDDAIENYLDTLIEGNIKINKPHPDKKKKAS